MVELVAVSISPVPLVCQYPGLELEEECVTLSALTKDLLVVVLSGATLHPRPVTTLRTSPLRLLSSWLPRSVASSTFIVHGKMIGKKFGTYSGASSTTSLKP